MEEKSKPPVEVLINKRLYSATIAIPITGFTYVTFAVKAYSKEEANKRALELYENGEKDDLGKDIGNASDVDYDPYGNYEVVDIEEINK
jgi:hypothetical protein